MSRKKSNAQLLDEMIKMKEREDAMRMMAERGAFGADPRQGYMVAAGDDPTRGLVNTSERRQMKQVLDGDRYDKPEEAIQSTPGGKQEVGPPVEDQLFFMRNGYWPKGPDKAINKKI